MARKAMAQGLAGRVSRRGAYAVRPAGRGQPRGPPPLAPEPVRSPVRTDARARKTLAARSRSITLRLKGEDRGRLNPHSVTRVGPRFSTTRFYAACSAPQPPALGPIIAGRSTPHRILNVRLQT